MRELLTDTATIKRGSRTGTDSQYNVSFANDETDAMVKLLPVSQSRVFSSLGQIPTGTYVLWVDGKHTIQPGDRVVMNSVTYDVEEVETHFLGHIAINWFHECLVTRKQST